MDATLITQKELEQQLRTELPELEVMRKNLVYKIGVRWSTGVLLLSAALLYFTYQVCRWVISEFQITNDGEVILAGIAVLFFSYLLAGLFLYKQKQKTIYRYLYNGEYAERYRKEVVMKAIPAMLEGLVYDGETGVPKADFMQSGFPFFGNPARYYSSGLIKGVTGHTPYVFSEVLAEELIQDGNTPGVYSDLFRGVFFIADFQKDTQWNTLVYPDMVKYFSAVLLRKLGRKQKPSDSNYQRVKLEDVTFEKYFEVYGADQVEARYILSPALMSRILDFRQRSGKGMQISFRGSKAYFAIHYPAGRGLFSPPLLKPVYDIRLLENYISEIRMMIELIKALNLNSRLVSA